MYFVSKRDSWLSLLTWGILGLAVIPALLSPRRTGLYILIPTMIFIGWVWLRTGYSIEGERLRVLCGPFRFTVPVREIQRIRKTNSPLSSPALSLDRLEIGYGKERRVMISPADAAGFIRAITGLNPAIQLDERLKRLL